MSELRQAIASAVVTEGGEAWAVGGAVRDKYLGYEAKDHDILVRMVPLTRLLQILPGRVELVGQAFGVIKVTANGETIDVALPRTERSVGIGHRDFEVSIDPSLSVEADLSRRDFTMNAIAINLWTDQVVDPYHGVSDIGHKIIRTVGNPFDRFVEDPLRMLRACRFVSQLAFYLDHDLDAAVVAVGHTINTVAQERISHELDRLLMGQVPSAGIAALIDTHLLEQIISEFMLSVEFPQYNIHHDKDVGDHVLTALDYAAIIKKASLRARWAVLLHDIAKPLCFTRDEQGRGHFYHHEDVGAVMAGSILTRLKQPSELILDVSRIVLDHLNPPLDASDKVLRRFSARMGDLTEDALICRESDLYAHAPPWPQQAALLIDGYRERIRALPEVQGFTAAQLAVHGGELIGTFGVAGQQIGIMKEAATKLVIDGELPNEHDAIMAWMKTQWTPKEGS